MNTTQFRKDLETLINENSMENGSNTPDYILADFLNECLNVFDKAVKERSRWYGNKEYIITDHSV